MYKEKKRRRRRQDTTTCGPSSEIAAVSSSVGRSDGLISIHQEWGKPTKYRSSMGLYKFVFMEFPGTPPGQGRVFYII